ncbi:hypothetical protein [Streptomyces sp. RFCAC02]|uniref:hypothetical protein n=1 Tax=Streptomyces sp. RFCAC02 TaxID=2499143 RepID=UPI00101F3A6D|nr:hypothetical protein [Streptomyces sp. RFCAC02]
MDQYAGRLLADRYRLPRTPSDEFELVESLAFDTASGQEVLVRQVPLPEVVDAEVLDGGARPAGGPGARRPRDPDRATRTPDDPVVRRAVEAALAASRLPDHPRLDQVFDVFVQGDGLWIVSEAVAARPLAAVLAERRLGPYRAAEVAADLLAALRIVHAHGWTHRNVTARTVLILDDGRALLTGLVAGAVEEVLCGYDPLPPAPGQRDEPPAARQPAPRPEPPARPGPGSGAWAPESFEPYDPAAGGGREGREAPRPSGRWADDPGTARPTPGGRADREAPRPSGRWADDTAGPRPVPGARQPSPGERWDRTGGGAGERGPEHPGPFADDPATPRPAPGGPRPGEPWGQPGAAAHREPGRPDPWADEPPADPAARDAAWGDPWADDASGLPPAPEGWERRTDAADPGSGATSLPHRRPGEEEPPPGASAAHGPGPGASVTARYDRWSDPSSGEGTGEHALPATWDFEGGAGEADPARGDRPGPAAPGDRPDVHGQPPAGGDRAARSGAIAAYRAGTRAGAARRGGVPPAEHAPGRASRSGWEPPARDQAPQGRHVPPGEQPTGRPALPAQRADTALARTGGSGGRYRGPEGALAAERARQARIMVVGAVTERWAPEQAGPVHEHWQLAPPVGPAADFWALGALLFRAVQGHPPYPEDSAAELVEAVCAEQPAFAEDCGALRPVIESLLRQDPTERPRAEELRGWLRSLLRSAPEPEVGRRTVTAPPALEPGRPADPRRLPIVRRRGELVGPRRRPRRRTGGGPRSPRRLGRILLVLVLLGLAGGIAYVLAFMSETGGTGGGRSAGDTTAGSTPTADPTDDTGGSGGEEPADPTTEPTEGDATQPSPAEGDQEPAPPPSGFSAQDDPAGFTLTVPDGWQRQGEDGEGRVTYADGSLTILVVPGRDGSDAAGADPMDYQLDVQPELDAFRDYQYGSSSGLFETRVGNAEMAEGVFRWREDGSDVVAFNRVVLIDGAYHVVLVRGPEAEEERLAEVYGVTADSYRPAE